MRLDLVVTVTGSDGLPLWGYNVGEVVIAQGEAGKTAAHILDLLDTRLTEARENIERQAGEDQVFLARLTEAQRAEEGREGFGTESGG